MKEYDINIKCDQGEIKLPTTPQSVWYGVIRPTWILRNVSEFWCTISAWSILLIWVITCKYIEYHMTFGWYRCWYGRDHAKIGIYHIDSETQLVILKIRGRISIYCPYNLLSDNFWVICFLWYLNFWKTCLVVRLAKEIKNPCKPHNNVKT